MPESSPTTPAEAGPTRTPTGTIQDQNTSILGTSPEPAKETPAPTTTPPKETPKASTTDGKSPTSLLGEKSPQEGAPENYSEFKVPEGFTLDGEVATQAGTLFKELNLSQTDAQKLVDFYVKETQDAFQAPFNKYMDTRQEWRDAINSDPEIGGSKLNGVRVSISKLFDSFGSSKAREEFIEAMNYTGAGDNPAVVRGLYRLSQLLTEGGAVRGNGPSDLSMRDGQTAQPSTAQAIYPHLPSNRG